MNDLKRALGEEVEEVEIPESLEEPAEADEQDGEFHEEIEALADSVDEDIDEPELSVGQSEYASLNEEALIEAMDDENDTDEDHPELEEVNAFVDQVAVENGESVSTISSDESIIALEELITTLKQADVRKSLEGFKMNISISFTKED